MDPARTEPIARNGSGLRPGEVVQRAGPVVGTMAARSASACPYGLGTACPLMEIVAGRLMFRNEILRWSRVSAVVLGVAVTISMLLIVHY